MGINESEAITNLKRRVRVGIGSLIVGKFSMSNVRIFKVLMITNPSVVVVVVPNRPLLMFFNILKLLD